MCLQMSICIFTLIPQCLENEDYNTLEYDESFDKRIAFEEHF